MKNGDFLLVKSQDFGGFPSAVAASDLLSQAFSGHVISKMSVGNDSTFLLHGRSGMYGSMSFGVSKKLHSEWESTNELYTLNLGEGIYDSDFLTRFAITDEELLALPSITLPHRAATVVHGQPPDDNSVFLFTSTNYYPDISKIFFCKVDNTGQVVRTTTHSELGIDMPFDIYNIGTPYARNHEDEKHFIYLPDGDIFGRLNIGGRQDFIRISADLTTLKWQQPARVLNENGYSNQNIEYQMKLTSDNHVIIGATMSYYTHAYLSKIDLDTGLETKSATLGVQ